MKVLEETAWRSRENDSFEVHVANTPDAPPVPDTSLLRYMFIDFDTWPTFSSS